MLKHLLHFCREEWEAGLRQNPILKHSLADLATSSAQWPLLGFADEDEFKEHMDPTVHGLSRSTDSTQRDLFERFLTRPEFTTAELIGEGFKSSALYCNTVVYAISCALPLKELAVQELLPS